MHLIESTHRCVKGLDNKANSSSRLTTGYFYGHLGTICGDQNRLLEGEKDAKQ